jgi:rSAM/selenodomain-associated transferase 1
MDQTNTLAPAFAVMAKAPREGRVKTRLVPPLTAAQAMALSAAFLADTVQAIREAGAERPIAPTIAYMPEGAEAQLQGLAGADVGLVLADGEGVAEPGVTGFGRSLLQAVRLLLARGHAGVCLISADSPTLPAAILAQAAALLAQPGERMVLGPAADGGYYLIGLKTAQVEVFRDIAWSTESVAATTLARAAAIGLECAMLPPWYDVDERETLTRLIEALADGRERAPRSAAILREFGLLA